MLILGNVRLGEGQMPVVLYYLYIFTVNVKSILQPSFSYNWVDASILFILFHKATGKLITLIQGLEQGELHL